MNNNKLIPLRECLTVNLFDKNSVDLVALHETGHVITMYALGMMDKFSYVTKKAGSETLGLTEVTDEFKAALQQLGNDIIQSTGNLSTGKGITQSLRWSRLEAARMYFPNICRLFGGGAICRYYHVPDEEMCSIDYNLIDTILMAFNLNDERETLLPLVDKYLNAIFASFELLTKTIYKNLVENETLQKDDVMQIIKDWEDFKLF